jgi:hypothetical protein
VEIDWEDELITWITSTKKFTDTFAEFGTDAKLIMNDPRIWGMFGIQMIYLMILIKVFINQINIMVMGLPVVWEWCLLLLTRLLDLLFIPGVEILIQFMISTGTLLISSWEGKESMLWGSCWIILRWLAQVFNIISIMLLYHVSYSKQENFPVWACLTKQHSYQPFGATQQVLLANDEGDKAPHEHDDAPPQPQLQPQGPPPMNPLDPLIPQIMNVIQQGMQVGMASFHSSYN